MERPVKRARLLSPDGSQEGSASPDASDELELQGEDAEGEEQLKINPEYAKRFEHNKKREELHRLKDKYGDLKESGASGAHPASESDSESESEDDEGGLATKELDDEIFAMLTAVKSKDPKVYDKNVKFYNSIGNEVATDPALQKDKSKPIHLRDYHRQNLLESGPFHANEDALPPSIADEEDKMKRELVAQMHNDADGSEAGQSDAESEDFLVRKPGQEATRNQVETVPELDVSKADEDPDAFLSSLMATRAWVPTQSSRFQPFESDDDDEDAQADEFEAAYNMRFEDPEKANEKLSSYSREAAAKHSVRREEPKGRKRARDMDKSKREDEKTEREKEKARLRNLKIEEAQEKLNKFKEVAGLKGQSVKMEDWSSFLDAGWDSDKWDAEMEKRFGDKYYAIQDDGSDEEGGSSGKSKKAKPKKPKWADDIDIGDIVPDFDKEENAQNFTITDDEDNLDESEGVNAQSQLVEDAVVTDAAREQERSKRKRQARQERRKIEELVDQSMSLDPAAAGDARKTASLFRYRDVSPNSFGLNAKDILMAEDSQLNQYAGLKKLASYRDADKKQKDKRKLSKKGRLRRWRQDTFGDADGSRASLQDLVDGGVSNRSQENGDGVEEAVSAKQRRKKKSKTRSSEGSKN